MNKTKSNDILEILSEFDSVRKNFITHKNKLFKDDGLALIVIHALIETILDFLLTRICKHGKYFSQSNAPFMAKVSMLDELSVIDDQMFAYLKSVNVLRNAFAHNLVIDDKWQKKLTLNKQDPLYKHFIKTHSLAELDGLILRIIFVWWRLDSIGEGYWVKEHFDRSESGHKKKGK